MQCQSHQRAAEMQACAPALSAIGPKIHRRCVATSLFKKRFRDASTKSQSLVMWTFLAITKISSALPCPL